MREILETSALAQVRPADKIVANLWTYSLQLNTARAYRLFGEMASRYPLIYDDGNSVVIDLSLSTTRPEPSVLRRNQDANSLRMNPSIVTYRVPVCPSHYESLNVSVVAGVVPGPHALPMNE
jgi:hypothetical protein